VGGGETRSRMAGPDFRPRWRRRRTGRRLACRAPRQPPVPRRRHPTTPDSVRGWAVLSGGQAAHIPARAAGTFEGTTRVATKRKVSSAEKAHRQSLKRRARNRQMRSRLRTMLKKVRAAIDARNVDTAAGLKEAFSLVDK